MTTSPDVSSEVHFLDVGQAHAMVAVDADSALVVDCPRDGVEQATALLNKLDLRVAGRLTQISRQSAPRRHTTAVSCAPRPRATVTRTTWLTSTVPALSSSISAADPSQWILQRPVTGSESIN